MSLTFGRKFWAGLVLMLILLFIYIFTALIIPAAINATVMITYGGFFITIGFMYIGGNVWNTWIKSKYFHSELIGK